MSEHNTKFNINYIASLVTIFKLNGKVLTK